VTADRTIRLGLVGAGAWGRNYIRTIAGLTGAVLARVASRNPDTESLVPPDCVVTPDWRDLVGAGDLDGLILAVPPKVQAAIAEAAIRARLPLLLEKPVAIGVAETRHLAELASQAEVPVLVDHVYLFHPAYVALKEVVRKHGGARAIRSAGGAQGPFRPDVPVLWDWAPHDIAMCLDLVGERPSVVAGACIRSEDTPDGRGEIWTLDLKFPCGTEASVTVGNLMEARNRCFTATLSEGEVTFDDCRDDKLVHRGPRGETAVPHAADRPLTRAVEAFASGLNGHGFSGYGLDLALSVSRVIAVAERDGAVSCESALV
jgi:predicted dehydrogenase